LASQIEMKQRCRRCARQNFWTLSHVTLLSCTEARSATEAPDVREPCGGGRLGRSNAGLGGSNPASQHRA
jgi:hypothetical protein